MPEPSHAYWREVLQNLLGPGLAVDQTGTVFAANAAAEQLFGRACPPAQSEPVEAWLPGWQPAPASLTVTGRRADGRQFRAVARNLPAAADGITLVMLDTASAMLLPAEAALLQVFQSSPMPMAFSDLKTNRYVKVNDAFLRVLGYRAEEVISRTPQELALLSDPGQLAAALHDLQTHGRFQDLETNVRTRSGAVRLGRFSGELIDIQGERLLFTVMDDVTDQRQMEAALRESEAKFRSYVENAPLAIFVIDEQSRYVDFNPAALEMLGYSAEALRQMRVADLVVPDDRAASLQNLAATREHGSGGVEVRLRTRAGRQVWVSLRAVKLAGGRLMAYCQDITRSREAEATYRLLAENSADVIWVLDPATQRFKYVSPSVERLRGFTAAEVLAQPMAEVLTAESRAMIEASLPARLAAFLAGDPAAVSQAHEVEQTRRDGSTVWTEVVTTLVTTAGGALEIVGVSRDITERRAGAAALAESEARYRVIFEGAAEGILAVDLTDRTFRYANPALCAMFGYTRAEFEQLTLADLHPPEALAAALAEFEAAARGEKTLAAALPCRRRDGRRFYADIKVARTDLRGRPYLIGFFSDVTERRRADALLRARLRLSDMLPTPHLDILLRKTLDEAEILTDSQIAYFHFVDEDQVTLSLQTWSTRTLAELCTAEGHGAHYPVDQAGVWADGLRLGRPLIYNDYAGLLNRKGLPAGHAPVTRLMTIPIKRNGQYVAMLGVGNKPADYDEHDLELATLLANEAWDLVMRQRAEDARRASEEKYRRLLDSLESSVATVDSAGRYHYVNPFGARTLGSTPEALVGRTLADFFPPAVADRQLAHIRQVIASGESLVNEAPAMAQGRPVWFRTSVHPVLDEAGRATLALINAVDITERKAAETMLEERVRARTAELDAIRQRLELATRSAGIGIWDWRCATGELVWDDQNLRLYGLTRADFDGSVGVWERALHPEDRPRQIERLQAARRGEADFDTEFRVVWPDGSVRYLRGVGLPIYDATGQAERMIGVNYDITARRQAEEVLRRTNQELERAMRIKDEFLAGMSHELRTPLNGILSLAEALEESVYGPLTPRQAPAVRTIGEAGQHLLALIGDVLDLSKIEAGKLELSLAPVAIDEACQACLRLIRQPAAAKRLRISLSLDGSLETVPADERRLKQMIVNLLSNAVKFTPDGGEIGLEVARGAGGQTVRFTVLDTGIGIAPEKQALLFQPFTQIDSSLTREHEGTGLGLSLVRRLAEMHGGQVGVASELGHGSRFYFELPLTAAPAPAVPRLRSAVIVDDSPMESEQLARYLRELGVAAVIERSGARAVERARAAQAEVVFLDLLLPDQSGWEVLQALQAQADTREIPVIICSVLDERLRGLAGGAAEFLLKPLTRDSLRLALARALPGPQPAAPAAQPPPAAPAAAGALILLAEDNPVNQRATQDFLQAEGYQVLLAQNGLEALTLAGESRPALILMDIQMPQLDGLEAIRRLRAQPEFAVTPIIALTALAMPGDRERCLAAGATDYLAKPFKLRHLADRLTHWLKSA